MVNTYALTDYDVYNEGAFDDYRRRSRKRIVRSRKTRRYPNKRFGRYKAMSFSNLKRYPRIVRSVAKKQKSRYRPILKRRKVSSKISVNILRSRGFPKRKQYPKIVRRTVRKRYPTYRPVIKRRKISTKSPVNILRPISFPKRKRYPRIVSSVVKKQKSRYRPILKRGEISPKNPINLLRPVRKSMIRSAKKKVLIRKKPKIKRVSKPINPQTHLIKKKNIPLKDKTLLKKNDDTMVQDKILAARKAMKSDSRSSKPIKIIAGAALAIIVGFGIYKFVKNKTSNGHISTNKGTGL